MAKKTLTMLGDQAFTEHFKALPAFPQDIPHIAANLRGGDRLELERFSDETPEEVMRGSLAQSVMAWTAFDQNDVPVAMWGVARFPQDPRFGVPWLLGTDGIGESYADFLRLSRHFDSIMSSRFHGLANMIDAEYTGALRWLEWLGFARGETITSNNGYPFIVMHKDTLHVR